MDAPAGVGLLPLLSVLHTAPVVCLEAANAMMVVVARLDEQPIDQIVALGLVDMKWARLGYSWQGPRLEPRFGHAAVAIGARLFVFGVMSGEAPSLDLLPRQPRRRAPRCVSQARDERPVRPRLDEPHVHQPRVPATGRPCYRHTAAAVRGKLFVFGGVNGLQTMVTLDTGLALMVTDGVSDADPLENAMAAAAAAAAEVGAPRARASARAAPRGRRRVGWRREGGGAQRHAAVG